MFFCETMDTLDSCVLQFTDAVVLFVWDFNADPGLAGGPFSSTQTNEQGRILARYLARWSYISAHLQFPGTSSHTYESDAHGSISTIDHVLCPEHFTRNTLAAGVEPPHPSNLSDHLAITASLGIVCQLPGSLPSAHHYSRATYNWSRASPVARGSYSCQVRRNLMNLPPCTLTSSRDLESISGYLSGILRDAAKRHIQSSCSS